jgi:hypothetical protein
MPPPPPPPQVLALPLSEEDAAAAAAAGPGALPEPEQMPAAALPLGEALTEGSPPVLLALQRQGALVVAGPERLEGAGWREVRLVVNGAAFKGVLERVVVALRGRSERFERGRRSGARFACAELRYAPGA